MAVLRMLPGFPTHAAEGNRTNEGQRSKDQSQILTLSIYVSTVILEYMSQGGMWIPL